MKSFHRKIIFFSLFSSFIVYSYFVYTIGTESKIVLDDSASFGKKIFQENNCIACHQIYGLGGYMGPDLTNVISLKGEDYAKSFITNGTEKMPNFNLDKNEIDALIDYLYFVDSSSNYPIKNVSFTWYGTFKSAE